MPLIYVTGPNGAGKSTLCTMLRSRGHRAYDTDQDGIARHYNNATNKMVSYPWEYEVRGDDWHYRHTYKISEERIMQLGIEAQDDPIFLCGIAANASELQPHFGTTIYLHIDLATMRKRLAQRRNNAFGKAPDELQFAIDTHRRVLEESMVAESLWVDAAQSPALVLQDVLELTGVTMKSRGFDFYTFQN